MAKANNSPTNWKEEITTTEKSDLLRLFDDFRKRPAVHKEDVEEINNRLDVYFKTCSDSGVVPTVEAMQLILGVSRQSLWKWQQSECEAGLLIDRAKQVINATLATATMMGRVNPVYSIWLQKNHFNYSDTQTLQLENITEKRALTAAELPKLGEWKTSLSANELPQLGSDGLSEELKIERDNGKSNGKLI